MENDLEHRLSSAIREIQDFPTPGIAFKDITPILKDARLSADVLKYLEEKYKGNVDVLVGIESRGFFFGFALAASLGIPFVPIRKKGKLPYKTKSVKYGLEYGEDEIEIHVDAIESGQRVLIHDDLLATGGTAAATAQLVGETGGELYGFNFIIHLSDLGGLEKIKPYTNNINCMVSY